MPSDSAPLVGKGEPHRISTIEARPGFALRPAGGAFRMARYGAAIGAVILLGMLGSWTHHAIETSLREMRAESLSSVLDAEVKALDVWIAEKRLSARRLAQGVRVRAQVEALIRVARAAPVPGDVHCASMPAQALRELFDPLVRDETLVAYHVVDREGRLLAAWPQAACGRTLSPASMRTRVDASFAGETRFVHPQRDTEGLVPARKGETAPAVIWILAPVEDATGRVVATLALGEYADGRFASILAAVRIGRSGEVYAFDERGYLLSESRFVPDLVARGLLPPSTHPSALLAIALRVPPGARNELEPPVLTRLAQAALAPPSATRRRGELLEPYENYRGAQVIGAWRWLPEHDMGVAVELEAEEAYAPLAFLNAAFGVVFGAFVLAVTAALLYVLWLKRQIGAAQHLGAYVLERKIGHGGMANVYLAHHALLRRPTAVKILRPEHSSEQFVARFEREVKLASQLTHPNTVEIYDYGRTAEGQFYYAMEYLDGMELLQLVKEGPVPVGRAVYLLRQVCAGLAEAHAKGLVHRDIKPENLMICMHGGEYDVVKILDFGLVKNVAEPHTRDLTRALKILGTPLYMAPERFRSPGDVDARADIYAVGAVAFYILTGRDVFEAADDLELSNRVLNDEAPRPTTVAPQPIPIELDLLVTACLEKRREDRPQHVTDLIEAFDALAVEHRWTQREAAEWWARHRGPAAPG